ncbi:hypothetical protein BSPWISOXPB_1592, partial [uncultured Gammaproteobacteria bacterium]
SVLVPAAMAGKLMALVSCLPNKTYDLPMSRALIIKSSKPSPLTSPALETKWLLQKLPGSPLITKPPAPIMLDKLMASVSCLPNTTYDSPAFDLSFDWCYKHR